MKNLPHLEYLHVQNFKSFKEIDLKLNRFNVIIGANASGKSNFVQIFNFLKDIREYGLDNAISLHGGIEYFANFQLGQEQNLVLELKISLQDDLMRRPFQRDKDFLIFYTGATWKFELRFGKSSGFKIIRDVWDVDIVAYQSDKPNDQIKGCIKIMVKGGKLYHEVCLPQDNPALRSNLDKFWLGDKIPSKKTILEYPFILDYLFPQLGNFFNNMMVYDFDPKLAKRADQLSGKFELNHDASNLAIIIKDVISKSDDKRKFFNLLTDVLPYVKSVSTENVADNSILFTLTENHFEKHSLPSLLISDGTINIISLIIALYFQDNSLTIIKEPERHIHPSLMPKLIEMMNEASSYR
ncbi:MAG: AAA family ATPase [Thaumarchaeota archaeon]|nr:AAA family ATPase [Nitrososphaerota archaeon]